jgi:hypothetical protein
MIWLDTLADAESMTPKQLAKKHGDEAARWALLQVELRQRAKRKFGDLAAQMLFEREALEQATQSRVARYHAEQLAAADKIVDVTAGIGGDSLAFAFTHPVEAFELNEERAAYARHNVALATHPVEVRTEDGLAWVAAHRPDYVWADPDRRRPDGRRIPEPEDYLPNPTQLADLFAKTRRSGIKLSPMLGNDYLESLGGAVEFVSCDGECCEAVVWIGRDVTPSWEAVILTSEGEVRYPRSEVDDEASEPSDYLFDIDPAVVRAHAMGSLGLEAAALGDHPGYLTGEVGTVVTGAKTYRVLHHGPPDIKRLREVLRQTGRRVFEVKQRGAGLDPNRWLKDLRTEGEPVSLVAWRVGKSIRVALCERI